MKKFLKGMTEFFNALAQARVAASLSRRGHYEEAAKVMQK